VPRWSVKLEEVSKVYGNGKVALNDVDLVVPEGDFVFLVGPSGAGKSTLIKLLVHDEEATTGSVQVSGRDLTRMRRRDVPRLRRSIGVIFQDFKLLPRKTVRENVSFALEVTGTPRRQMRGSVERVLALVGLTDQANQRPNQLSGGEQQRVAIARAFSNSPRYLFADEPTGNLDSDTGAHIVELLEQLNREAGTTIILVTHDLTLAHRAQRIIRLADGVVVSDAMVESAAAQPALEV
jgi:cell division transport system ATP-binding protein